MHRAKGALAVLVAIGIGAAGCRSNRNQLGELAEVHGSAERDFAKAPESWEAAAVGASFGAGDALRTRPSSDALIRLKRGGGLKLGPSSVVRFHSGPEAARHLLAVESGEAEIESGPDSLSFDTRFGQARLESGGRVRIRATSEQVRFEVAVGRTIFERDGGLLAIGAGDKLDLSFGSAVVEHAGEPPANAVTLGAPQPQVPDSGGVSEPTPDSSITAGREGNLESQAPPRTDFSIPSGESAVVHDPNAPTAVRVQFTGICDGEGEVEMSGPAARSKKRAIVRARGTGSAVVFVGLGKNRYRVRCGGGANTTPRSEGTIWVAKDSGKAHLPSKPAHNTIDADGRSYTVLYQNLLPQLTVTWPRAPSGNAFILHVEPERAKPRTIQARTAEVRFLSGQLAEGTHHFWFSIPGNGVHRSPRTALRIAFDNAAPAAHIQEPPAGAPIHGSVNVAGVASEGTSVSVNGAAIPLDAQFRFRGEASAASGESSLAIRIAHPKHGVHYYVRRVQGGGS